MKQALIPVFPLPLVVFPDEVINLHIFEARYKQLVNEADVNGSFFGVPTYLENKKLTYGTEVSLQEIVKVYPDGKLDVRIRGQRIFNVDNFMPVLPGRLYPAADITYINISREKNIDKNKEIIGLLRELYKYLKMHKPLPQDAQDIDSYRVAHYIGLSLEDELRLLAIPSEEERLGFIISHLKKITPVLKEMNALEKKVKMNGHFRNIIPPDNPY